MCRRFLILIFVIANASGSVQAEIVPDFAMDADPVIVVPNPIKRITGRLAPMWIAALGQTDDDLQRMAAESIAVGHPQGVGGLISAVPELERIVSTAETHTASRYAAARALIALDSRKSARLLLDVARRHGADLRQLIEPALAGWKDTEIRTIWLDRLSLSQPRRRDLVLAIQGLGKAGEAEALTKLKLFVVDPLQFSDVRLESAVAAGLIADHGLEDVASRLLADSRSPATISHVCAVRILARHDSESARGLLLSLALDEEPAVAAAALGRLLEIDASLVLPLAERAMQNADPHVRRRGAQAYITLPDPERVAVLARLLDDPHPDVRGTVREALFSLAGTAELSNPIRAQAMQVLAGESWRGQEQAALLLTALDHKPAAGQFIQLLESRRSEVMIATAWGLKRLAVPETLPAILSWASLQTAARKRASDIPTGLDSQVAHLLEALGRMRYSPAEPLMREHIPKDFAYGNLSRGAAIWSLGLLHEGDNDEILATALIERLTDPTMPSELELVRQMCAVSLARMKAVSQTERIRKYMGPRPYQFRTPLTMRWAVMQLTGENMPEPEPKFDSRSNWFLEPFEPVEETP